jgi:hypothetical protein
MKAMRRAVLCFVVLLLTAPMLRAQDFSKYRNFSLGTNLAAILCSLDFAFSEAHGPDRTHTVRIGSGNKVTRCIASCYWIWE